MTKLGFEELALLELQRAGAKLFASQRVFLQENLIVLGMKKRQELVSGLPREGARAKERSTKGGAAGQAPAYIA